MFTTTVCIVDSLFLSWWRRKGEFARNSFLFISLTEMSMFPFYGGRSFQIRLARRRAHPCDEQVVAAICSFCLYMHVKVSDSILSGGASRRDVQEHRRRWQAGDAPRKQRSKVGEGEIRRSSINIMEICNSSVPTPVRKCRRRHELLRAEGVCLHAEMENLPAEVRCVNRWRKRVGAI